MSSTIIGGLNEKSLHRQLKEYYSDEESLVEEKVSGYIVDIVNPCELVEIQTSNFSGIKNKLTALLQEYRVRLVHPVAAETVISVYEKDGSLRSRRKSPKRESLSSAAAQLLYIADLLPNPALSVEITVIRQEEIRYDDGKGSWRRKGVSIEDRLLVEILESHRLAETSDYLRLLPQGLPSRFGNRELSEALSGTNKRGRTRLAGQITWLLRRLELIRIADKEGNRMLFER